MTSDNQERTAKGTIKRDPNAPKLAPPATPEERAERIAAAKAAAVAAKARGGSGAGLAPPRVAAGVTNEADAAEVADVGPPDDGVARTAKGTIKRDPNAPKLAPPATPEERAARIAAAKAAAVAAKEKAKAAPAAASSAVAAAARPARAAPASADQAAFVAAYTAITKPVPGAAPVLRTVTARAERVPPPNEFPITDSARATVDLFREVLRGIEFTVQTTPNDAVLILDKRDLYRALERAKFDPRLDMRFLRSITAVDLMDEGIDVVYHLKSLTTRHSVAVKALLPHGDLEIESVVPLWPGANWLERETREMFGIEFVGHPDPRNLLLDEDMTIHPLLKAHPLAEVELKQGVNVF